MGVDDEGSASFAPPVDEDRAVGGAGAGPDTSVRDAGRELAGDVSMDGPLLSVIVTGASTTSDSLSRDP